MQNLTPSITAKIPRISIKSSDTNFDRESFQTECGNDAEDTKSKDNPIQIKAKRKGKSSNRKTRSQN